MRKHLYTSTSLYRHAVVNSYWAILRGGYHPQDVTILITEGFEEQPGEVIPAMERVSEYEMNAVPSFKTVDLTDVDYTELYGRLVEIFSRGVAGGEAAIDISPGRKYLVVPAVLAGSEVGVKHVFYTFMKDLSWGDVPLPLKPFTTYRVYDLFQGGE